MDTIEELRNLQPGSASEVKVEGYYEVRDGGGGTFYWDANSTQPDNNGTIIQPRTGGTGRWKRDYSNYDHINVLWFGARVNTPSHNNTININAARNYALRSLRKVYLPKGIYWIKNNIVFSGSDGYTSDFEFYGDYVLTEDNEGRTIVDENNSTIIKASAKGSTIQPIVINRGDPATNVKGLRLYNFAVSGNKYAEGMMPAAGNNILLYRHDISTDNIVSVEIYNIATIKSTKSGIINLGGNNIRIHNIVTYLNDVHGIVQGPAGGHMPVNCKYWDIETYKNGFGEIDNRPGRYGVDLSGGSAIVNNVQSYENWGGMKTSLDSKNYEITNVVLRDNYGHGFTQTGDQPNLELYMDNIIAEGNGWAGIRIVTGSIRNLGKIITRNNGLDDTNNLYGNVHISNAHIEELIVTDLSEESGSDFSASLFGNTTVDYIEVFNNDRPFRIGGDVTIRSGHIYNNKNGGLYIWRDQNVQLYNLKFGSPADPSPYRQTYREIYDSGTATLIHGGLDFTDSKVSSQNKIVVQNVQEVGAVLIEVPETGEVVDTEKDVNISARATHPSASVVRIEFFVNGTKIGEQSNEPFHFEWTDTEPGSYTIKARAYFDDNTTAESNAVRVYVSGRHSMILQQGWNTISSFIKPNEDDIATIFEDIQEDVSLVLNNNGDVYWPLYDINEIGSWDSQEAYQVYMNAPATLTLYGQYLDPGNTSIYLKSGWNLKPYIPGEPMPVETAFRSVESSIEIVTNNAGDMYWPAYDVNTIGYMQPGEGYRIYAARPSNLTYPVSESPNVKISGADNAYIKNTTIPKPQRYTIAPENTGSNAFLILKSNGLENGDEVGVWNTDDILVGSGVVNNNIAAITIWGRNTMNGNSRFGARDDELLRLTLWSDNEEKEIPLRLNSLSCLTHGELDDHVIRYEEGAVLIAGIRDPDDVPDRYALHQNYPNPFNPTTTIEYNIPRDEKVTLEVYNLLGQKITTLVNEKQRAGTHRLVFKADKLASGVYFYRLQAGNYTNIKRMIVLR